MKIQTRLPMKTMLLFGILTASLLAFGRVGVAAEKADAKGELQNLVSQIQDKLREGKKSETDLGEDLKKFDALLAQHKGEKTDDVAQILLMKALLYVQVLDNAEKGLELAKQLKTDFPETTQGKNVDKLIGSIQKQQNAKKMQETLVVGAPFPDFEEKDTAGKPLSIANCKGKVVLIDFWATWCGPCIGELPNVLNTYKKYHDKGFEIIGISLDKDEKALASFIKKEGVTWQQFFDGKGWENKLAEKYGILSIPATYLLDGGGKIVATNLRGEALETEVGKLLAKP
ncbi:MAG: TlpA family protein disulfide reductase [Verrucomicrobia bacterium]|nr:TlpA family protein disulfide reductase [Verrucomicrobiota bacterium]